MQNLDWYYLFANIFLLHNFDERRSNILEFFSTLRYALAGNKYLRVIQRVSRLKHSYAIYGYLL